jgi:antirestriction protein ArdC
MQTTARTNPYEVITDRILALLAQGTIPWQQPWDSTMGLPRNLCSQRAYRGINVWLLTAMGFPSPFWATFQQVTAAGGRVRKGAHGLPVVFWRVYNYTHPETGEADKRFVLRQYTVFNAAQLDGVAIPEITVLAHRFTPIERCASLVDAMPQRPLILHGHPRACYTPATDTLHLPHPTCFHSPEAYYATVFHELVHSVGHRARLNRPTLTDPCRFGDPTYAKEELVAECGAAYLCGVCGIANATLAPSAAYLQSWMQVLRHDPTMLVHAAAQAQKAADYIQNLSPDTGPVRESDDHTPRRRAPTA